MPRLRAGSRRLRPSTPTLRSRLHRLAGRGRGQPVTHVAEARARRAGTRHRSRPASRPARPYRQGGRAPPPEVAADGLVADSVGGAGRAVVASPLPLWVSPPPGSAPEPARLAVAVIAATATADLSPDSPPGTGRCIARPRRSVPSRSREGRDGDDEREGEQPPDRAHRGIPSRKAARPSRQRRSAAPPRLTRQCPPGYSLAPHSWPSPCWPRAGSWPGCAPRTRSPRERRSSILHGARSRPPRSARGLDILRDARRLNADKEPEINEVILLLSVSGSTAKALALAEQVVDEEPQNVDAWFALWAASLAAGDRARPTGRSARSAASIRCGRGRWSGWTPRARPAPDVAPPAPPRPEASALAAPARARELQVRLDYPLPGQLAVGRGTAVFVCGWCFCPGRCDPLS